MLLTAKCVFTHLPKTGGTWVRQAMRDAGIPCFEGAWHVTPGEVLPVLPDRYSFTFVRHPVTWWRSWWAHTAAHGISAWPEDPFRPAISRFTDVSYAEFMTRMLGDVPGQYSRIVDRYTDGVTRTGRTERLAEDLPAILGEAGERAPVVLPPANVTRRAVAADPGIDAEITRTEQAVIARFYAGGEDL